MKSILSVLFVFITITTFAQDKESVDLRWKIQENEDLNYMTAMKEIDSSYMEMDLGSLFNALSTNKKEGLSESQKFFNQLNKVVYDMDYITTLHKKEDGVVDIQMKMYDGESDSEMENDTIRGTKTILRMMSAMNEGIVLRGSVLETGEVHSFWLQSRQKNLISVFFELPNKPVSIGDTWELDVNFITNDQNFECDSSYKINEVTLVDIKVIDGERIAVLKYNLDEYVHGTFNSPALFETGGKKDSMMRFSHQAIAEFSIDKGRWISYNGIMSLEAKGVMNANKKTKFTLLPK
ncbi:hypothetical protein ACE193_19870 [Bernardetia sp. OM2101]|uniref:hypothetical protein n=1 Tax=Bernardetia sp. OM2101 TaxID=3344876 RepID=UPI0035D11E92